VIHDAHRQVDDQVEQDDGGRAEREAAEAGEIEDLLDEDRAPEDEADAARS